MNAEQRFFDRKIRETAILLNEVQQQAVVNTEGPMLLLASPGSGKTTTMIMRIGYLIEQREVNPFQIKALTFSKASANDMQQRFKQLFPRLTPPTFSTIHSFAYEVTRSYLRRQGIAYEMIEGDAGDANSYGDVNGQGNVNDRGQINVDSNVNAQNKRDRAHAESAAFSAAGNAAIYREAGAQHTTPHKKHILRQLYASITRETLSDEQMDELTTYISYIKNKLLPATQWLQVKCDVPQAGIILQQYEQFKQSVQGKLLIDFDDMLVIANQALEKDESLLSMYRQRFSYILTDESQDTSLVQHYIIKQLVEQHRNLCVVADDDQSIYSWRGAEPGYLLQFQQSYPDAQILYMEQNYRSTKTIVDAAAQFITHNQQRYPKSMFTDNAPGEPITFYSAANAAEQTKHVVKQIASEPNLAEVAVLYRNNACSIPLMNALERAGIPFYVKDADLRFFSHWVVEDVLNFMRMSYTDKRVDILEKIHLKFNGYISKQQMAVLKSIQNDESVFDNLLKYIELHDYQVELLKSSQETFQQMKGMPPLPAIRVIRERLGYEKALEKMCERLGFRREYLLSILNTLEEIAEDLPTMEQFASRLKQLHHTLKQAVRRRGECVVTLSTLHSAKGLEFEKVYMIDLLEGIIPSAQDIRQEELEEAVRLFYVGMTRAKQHLELITYKERGGDKAEESRFVTAVRQIVQPEEGDKLAGQAFPAAGSAIGKGQIAAKQQPLVMQQSTAKQQSLVKRQSSAWQQSAIKQQSSVKQQQSATKQQVSVKRQALAQPKHPNAIANREQLQPASTIIHTKFGAGVIVACSEERVDIQFAEGLKRLALAPCLDNGLLLPGDEVLSAAAAKA